jgi:hypothetical protein
MIGISIPGPTVIAARSIGKKTEPEKGKKKNGRKRGLLRLIEIY